MTRMRLFNVIIAVFMVVNLVGCDKLDLLPKDVMSKDAVFNNEKGLELYSNSFYNILPSAEDLVQADLMSDMLARKDVPNYIRPGAYSPRESSGWSWTDLRNINSFIQNLDESTVDNLLKNHYRGLARFFRAWFYFDKVVRFGDVPWVSIPLDVDDDNLYNKRDDRFTVMDSVLSDINYAIENIDLEEDESRTLVTKNVALAFKSRVCLFEGTFRKYHIDFGYSDSADRWLEESASAAKEIIESGKFSVYMGENSYRDLFISKTPVSQEVMLSKVFDTELGVLHRMNWFWTSATTGVRGSFTRTFMNTYLNIDGSPFTDNPNFMSMTFQEETKNRDLRLSQTIRTKGYTRLQGSSVIETPPLFSYTYTGYQPIKRVLDDYFYDGNAYNDNALPVIRYSEVLLNYAEAKAELKKLNADEWDISIGVLRERAGIKNRGMPTEIDSYFQENYFPDISDPIVLEVRRERSIELVLEGFRLNDLIRWKRGELLEMEWNGMYVPEVNSYIDLNEDGDPDVYFYVGELSEDEIRGVSYINVSSTLDGEQVNQRYLREGNHGEIIWMDNIPRKWEDKNYFYPIPESDLLINPALEQNPGW